MSIKYGSLDESKQLAATTKPASSVGPAPFIDEAEVEPEIPETFTNWKALAQAGLKPVYFRCDTPQEVSHVNLGCHTALRGVDDLIRHMDGDHGGSYFISFREGFQQDPIGASSVRQGRHWDGWAELEAAGVEIKDFRCDVCNAEIKINSRSILKHIRPHSGKISRSRPGGDFWLTISRQFEPDPDQDE